MLLALSGVRCVESRFTMPYYSTDFVTDGLPDEFYRVSSAQLVSLLSKVYRNFLCLHALLESANSVLPMISLILKETRIVSQGNRINNANFKNKS